MWGNNDVKNKDAPISKPPDSKPVASRTYHILTTVIHDFQFIQYQLYRFPLFGAAL